MNLENLIHPVTKKYNHQLAAKHRLGQTTSETCLIDGYPSTCVDGNKTSLLVLGFFYGLQSDPDTPSNCLYSVLKVMKKATDVEEEIT